MIELDQTQQIVDARLCRSTRHAVERGEERQVLLGGQVSIEHRLVGNEPYASAQGIGLLQGIYAEHTQFAACGARQQGELAQ